MKKRVYLFCLGMSIIFVSACAHRQEERMVVKSLDETISFPETPRSADDSARYFMDYFKEKRDSKIKYLVDRFDISDPMFMIEWGGGLVRIYVAIIATETHLYYWSLWDGYNTYGEVSLDPTLSSQFKETAAALKDYDGEKRPRFVCDGVAFFMTFYKKNIPVRTFTEYYPSPRKYKLPEGIKDLFYEPLHDELADLVDTIVHIPGIKLR